MNYQLLYLASANDSVKYQMIPTLSRTCHQPLGSADSKLYWSSWVANGPDKINATDGNEYKRCLCEISMFNRIIIIRA